MEQQDPVLAADRAFRIERDARLSPAERLERVADLCRDLAALRVVTQEVRARRAP